MQIQPSDVTHAIQQLAHGVGEVVRTVAYAAASGLQTAWSQRQSTTPGNVVRNARVPHSPDPNPLQYPPWATPPAPVMKPLAWESLSWIGTAPGDGNCFFHSTIEVAGGEIADRLGLQHQAALTPRMLRQHLAGHLMDLYRLYNDTRHLPAAREALLKEYPHLIALTLEETRSPLDLRYAEHQAAFADAVGDHNLAKCDGLTPSQMRHVFNVAADRSWDFDTCDVMPHLLASSLPGLRLSVVSPTSREMSVIGHGVDPVHVLYVDQNHYVPARV